MAVAMTDLNNIGFYGKMPSNGDFVSRNLPRAFIDPWDQWLQECITASHQQLGDDWLNNYLTAPIWRFALSKEVCGDSPWIGLVMPSVDSAGRYFPLTVAAPANETCKLFSIADNEASWFLQAEEVILSALDQNNNLDSFNQDLDNLGIPNCLSPTPTTPQNETQKFNQVSSDSWRISMSESKSVSANLSSLMEELIMQRFPEFTVWWTSGSNQVEPSILICNKLPPTQGFSALMTGHWDHWGWDNKLINHLSTVKNDNGNAAVEAS